MSKNLIGWRLAAGGYKLLAHGFGRYRHPQDSATLSQTAYTYYFAQAITAHLQNLQLLAIRIKQLANNARKTTIKAQSSKQKDPHPLFIFHNAERHSTLRNTPVTVLGPRATPPVYQK